MSRARQPDFFTHSSHDKLRAHGARSEHGGAIRQGRRKLKRPFDSRRSMHLVFRSTRAQGEWFMLRARHDVAIRGILRKVACASGVRILQFANSGNHLHLLVLASSRDGLKKFTRTFGALVARAVTGAKKGKPVGKFWDTVFYSRIVAWGRAYFAAKYYVIQNELESLGLIGKQPRRGRRAAAPGSSSTTTGASPPGSAQARGDSQGR